jgi:hypothetical protein
MLRLTYHELREAFRQPGPRRKRRLLFEHRHGLRLAIVEAFIKMFNLAVECLATIAYAEESPFSSRTIDRSIL